MSYLFNNYNPLDIAFEKGKGCYLYANNNKYLDAFSGVGVVNLGHNHPQISKVIAKQAKTLLHTSNWYRITNEEYLGQKLAKLANMQKVFFSNSGAEANETAIKLTRLYAKTKGIDNPIILTANNAFHGRTMATISATGSNKVKKGFAPLVPEFIHIDFNNIDAINSYTDNKNIIGLMLEPILGEAGVIIPANNYLNQAQAICEQNNWLFILDEVQTGIGRTGKLFAHQHNNITPDILTLAKGLGNGVPIAACLGGHKVAKLFTPGSHGSTYGGNPFCTKVALTVLEIITKEQILENVIKMSDYFLDQAKKALISPKIKNIRAKGLMVGITLDKTYSKLAQKALDLNVLLGVNDQHIRLLPPLIITQKDIDFLLTKLKLLLESL